MAELTEYEQEWIAATTNAPIDDLAMQAAARKEEARTAKLELFFGDTSEFAINRDSIADAQEFTITKAASDSAWKKALSGGKGKEVVMKWRATDEDLGRMGWESRADVEVDSVADLRQVTEEIPVEKIDTLTVAYDRLLGLQQQMLNQFDSDGNRMFSDEDIRRELWNPLVRDGTIPENLVPQKFSEQAIAFKGAAEMYQERITEYSKNSSGKEDLIRGLKITGDTLSLVGTVASSSVSIGDANESASIKQQLDSGKGSDGAPLSDSALKALKARKAVLGQRESFTKLGVTMMTGGFDLVTSGVEEHAKDKNANWAGFADKGMKFFAQVVAAGAGPIANQIVGVDPGARGDAQKAQINLAKKVEGGILGAVAGLRLAPALVSIARADPKDRVKFAQALINQFADAVHAAMIAAASDMTDPADKERKDAMIRNAAYVKTAILASGNAPRAIEKFIDGKPGEAMMFLGAGALQGTAAGVGGPLVDAMKKDVTQQDYSAASVEERLAMEVTDDPLKADAARTKSMGTFLDAVNKNGPQLITSIQKDIDAGKEVAVDPSAAEFAASVKADTEAKQQQVADAQLIEAFGDREAVDQMFSDFEDKMVGYEELYTDATPPADPAEMPPDEAARALKAIDRAIQQTSALRARAEMINGITSAGAGIAASFIPGGGAIVAAQAVAYDIFCLVRAVQMHNKWVDSMEVAFRAGSAYSPAIERTMMGARITLSQKSVKLVLDSIKLGNEVARCFDPTGTTTIIASGLTMTTAVVEYGFKMHKEAEIDRGWKAYVVARANPANRKAARKALRMNSTLAKCCIAYGACIVKDAGAQEAIRISGLTPSAVADDKDVCKRLVTYLENELSEDPVVMHVERQPKKWQPGRPTLSPASWFEVKTAASISAEPRLDAGSVRTPAIDSLLAQLAAKDCFDTAATFNMWQKANASDDNSPGDLDKRRLIAGKAKPILEKFIAQIDAYKPLEAGKTDTHSEMSDIALTFKSLARLNLLAVEKALTA